MVGRRFLHAVAAAGLAATAAATSAPQPARAATIPPPIKHVVVIVLENSDAANNFAFGKALAPYLNNTLVPMGVEIPLYYGTGHASLDNYIAMVSGQAPNPRTQGDCNDPSTLSPGTLDASGQAFGSTGCTYPANVLTVADQLATAGYSWKGYMEDMGNSPATARSTCRGPGAPVNPSAPPAPAPTDKYATKHNPFVYFSSITGLTHTDNNPAGSAVSYTKLASCDAHDVPLTQLATDLATPGGLPNFAYITPNLCSDGHDVCGSSNPDNGLAQADNFLATWVPKILATPAFQPGGDGLLVVNWDEGEGDSTSCCNEQPGPNLSTFPPGLPTNPGNNEPPGQGGGQTGAVAVGPFIAPNSPLSMQSYNHYSLLRSIEDIFGLSHLGYAGATGLAPFGSDVYTNAAAPVTIPEVPAVALLALPAAAILVVGWRRRPPRGTTVGMVEP